MTRLVRSSERRLGVVSIALALAIVLVPAVVGTKSAEAQTFKVLYTFTNGADGGEPYAGLIRDAKGNLYGTTSSGGTHAAGTVFKIDKTGKETVLYSFTGPGKDGAFPIGGVILDAGGNLYGTTLDGGTGVCYVGNRDVGCGVVFMVHKSGKETVLYSFSNTPDGATPEAGLVRDAGGNLYGMTFSGGSSTDGTVFKLNKAGKETVLHSFTGDPDGSAPFDGLVRDKDGNLYGVTELGGNSNAGTVLKLDNTGTETVLYSFTGAPDGAYPGYGYLWRDAAADLYGATLEGGAYGYGTVFKLDKTGKETVLYSFTGTGGDGLWPSAGVVQDVKGNLYGTTYLGGASGYGTIFKVDKTGKETVLHSFAYETDGEFPVCDLLLDAKGNLYGTATYGGSDGYGTVFELTP